MITAKVEDLKRKGRWMELRKTAAVQHWYSRGLADPSSDGEFSRRGSFMSISKRRFTGISGDAGRLKGLKITLNWRGHEGEKHEVASTGSSLLTWAVLANDLPSVRELLNNHKEECDTNLALAQEFPELAMLKGTTPLMLALASSNWQIVELLLDHGADPTAVTTRMGLDCVMLAAVYGNSENIKAWLTKYPAWDLERRELLCGFTVLSMTLFMGCSNMLETVNVLLHGGSNAMSLNHGACVSLLHAAAINPDSSLELLAHLLSHKGGMLKPLLRLRNCPRSRAWRFKMWLARVLDRVGKSNAWDSELAWWEGATPLQMAAGRGHLAATRVLIAVDVAALTSKNTQGKRTPALVSALHRCAPPTMLENCIEAGSAKLLRSGPTSSSARSRRRAYFPNMHLSKKSIRVKTRRFSKAK
jgi:hypothetical protein